MQKSDIALVSKWFLDNAKCAELLGNFFGQFHNLMKWQEEIEYEKKMVEGLDGSFSIKFLCPVHNNDNELLNYCVIELEALLIRHNPVILKHIRHSPNLREPKIESIDLIKEDDCIYLEMMKSLEPKIMNLIHKRLKDASK